MPFGNGMSIYGLKPRPAAGTRVNPAYGLITGVPADVNNKFIPGAGVGSQNIFTRRAKNRYATVCRPGAPCGNFYMKLGIHPRGNGQNIAFY
jgi:hypothetical protein